MKIYTVHIKKDSPDSLEEAVFVKEGFSFWGAVFQTLWALYNKMWLSALLLFLVSICFITLENYAIINGQLSNILKFGFLIFVGFSANDWYRKALEKKGFTLFEIVSANGLLEAKQKFLYSHINKYERQEITGA